MTLVLRKCNKDGSSSYGFFYGQVGERVTAPDWIPDPICGHGLHGLKEGNGDWGLLDGKDWLVIEANESDIVEIDEDKCKFRTGKILFRGTKEELVNSEFPHKFNLNSKSAFEWALNIGNKKEMIKKITNSQYAYLWSLNIGNYDVMKPKITEKYWIERWNLTFISDKIER